MGIITSESVWARLTVRVVVLVIAWVCSPGLLGPFAVFMIWVLNVEVCSLVSSTLLFVVLFDSLSARD